MATRRGPGFLGRVSVVALLAIFGFTGSAPATSYTYEIFSSPFDQSALNSLYHDNTVNQSGGSVARDGSSFSFCSGGNCSYISPPLLPTQFPGAYYPTFLNINNRDQVAVTYGNIYGPCFSYSWEKGVFTQISGLNDPHVKGINNSGAIVGSYANYAGGGYAYVWQNGAATSLIPSGWEATRPYGINDEGKVWGFGNLSSLGRMLNGIWSTEYWFTAAPVRTPEPYTLLLIASGLLAIFGLRKSIRR